MPKRKREEGFFRIQRKTVGLTYSCPTDEVDNPIETKEEILDFMTNKFGTSKYLICQEPHIDMKRHFHAYFKFDVQLDVADSRAFDIKGVHPNIINPGGGWIPYVAKTENYITNFYKENNWTKAASSNTVTEAVTFLWESQPKEMMLFGEKIEGNLMKKLRTEPTAVVYYGPYPEHYYPKDEEWNPETHSLLLWGAPDLQKTQFAKYLMAHKFGETTYMKGHYEVIKKHDLSKPWILDEVRMHLEQPENSKEITDIENGGTVQCRHSNCTIPAGVPRIFISNMEYPFCNPSGAVYNRRVKSKHLYRKASGGEKVGVIDAPRPDPIIEEIEENDESTFKSIEKDEYHKEILLDPRTGKPCHFQRFTDF